jgi:acetoin:2,6-dichlorophenolindophenol oxidoreductase subunit alpha
VQALAVDELQKRGISTDQAHDMLMKMMLIRSFEEKAEELFALGRVHGTMHLSIGQEGSAVGLATALAPRDYLLNTHRGHGHCLAWYDTSPDLMMAEFMGKEAGYCRGRGGSMHIANVDANNLGANGIVGGGLPLAVGVGLTIKLRKTDQVAAAIFGDGGANTGAFHESLNMASIWNLPILYFCENNQYAMSMAFTRAFNIDHVSDRAVGYGIHGVTVDGNDVLAVYDVAVEAIARARRTLIESLTYRWKGHSKSDKQAYRTRDEVKEWQEKDPIRRFAAFLGMSDAERDALQAQAQARIEQSVDFSEASPEPDLADIMEGVYA